MKSWKTTVAGYAAGIPLFIDAIMQATNAGTFTGKSGGQLIAAIAIVCLGIYSKDHNVTGK